MPNKSRCCNPFCCFSACAQTAPSESGPGASHDVADVSGVPRCDKAPPSGSSNVDARLNVSGPPRCDDGSSSGSSNVPNTRSEEEDADVNLNASGDPPCINEASTSGSSNVPNRSEEQDVDFNLNVSGDPRCINEAPSCSSSSGATKSRPDLISSIRKDIVEVEDVNLDDLMNHISELLKLREEGKQQQASNIRKFPWPNVPGLQKLKEIVSFGTDLQKLQNMLSAALTFGSELVTTCGVDQFKGKTILLDLRAANLFDDIGLPCLKEMYDVVVKDNLDLEIISIPICQKDAHGIKKPYEVPWFIFQSGTWNRERRKVAQFFLTKQCGWEEGDACEKWYASINCIIEPNGRVIPCRRFTKYRAAKSTPILEFLFNHMERVSDQVKRIMFQVKWGVKACPTVHEEIENFKKEEWEQLKSMSTLEFLFNHLESTSDQVKKLMCQGKIICLHNGHADNDTVMKQMSEGIHIINVGHLTMESLALTDIIYKEYYNFGCTRTHMKEMSSLNLSSHELIRFSLRLHYLKEEINRIEESDKKLSELKSVLHSFQDVNYGFMTFMDQYGKVIATLGANDMSLIGKFDWEQSDWEQDWEQEELLNSMINHIEAEGKEMHDEDPAVSDSLIQNMQTASVAVEQNFESLLEYISELWAVEFYQLFKFNKAAKKSSPSRVTWPASKGFCMLKNFLSEGTHANWVKDVISRHPEEVMCETVIKSLLKDIEEENLENLFVAGLLGIAHVLERFDSVSANRTEWLLVLLKLLILAQNIKMLDPRWELDPELELSWRKIKRAATVLIVIYSIACSAVIDPSKLALFELSTLDNDWLRTIQKELEWSTYLMDNARADGLGSQEGFWLEIMCDTFEFFFETSW